VRQEVRWFSTGACYIFHTVNAWDEGDTVVLVACRAAFTSVLGICCVSSHLARALSLSLSLFCSSSWSYHSFSLADLEYMNNREMEKELIAKSRISLHRWEFDLRTGTTHEKALDKTVGPPGVTCLCADTLCS
jgi:carotenoid cleavage dioxygenase-like enzyme